MYNRHKIFHSLIGLIVVRKFMLLGNFLVVLVSIFIDSDPDSIGNKASALLTISRFNQLDRTIV